MKRRDLKVLMSSNAPWSNSGYARWISDWAPRMKDDGWNTRLIGWAGLAGGVIDWKGIYTYPQIDSIWGDDALFNHGNHFGAHVRMTMQDVHSLSPQWLQQMKNWIPYTPIDREEVPENVLNALKYANRIITFSKFGQKALERKGFASLMIPEGVDTSVFKPLDKMKVREQLGWPKDKIIVGMIGANKPDGLPRKGWQQALEAFKLFSDKHPDSLFFHQFNQGGGFDIAQYAQHLGIIDKIIGFDMYMAVVHGSSELVNNWLNGCDFLIHPSSTEGFGLVVAESQAAGTPVVINNIMSMPELIIEGKTGEACSSSYKIWSPGGGYVYLPDSQDLAAKMEKLYARVKSDENKVSTSCRAWIKDNYDMDKIFKEKWVPFFESLQEELLPKVDEVPKKV